jgi:hypothetical protein
MNAQWAVSEHEQIRIKQPAPERPSQEERALDPGAVFLHVRVAGVGDIEQTRDERGRDQCVKVHIKAVEQPAQLRGQARFPLRGGEVAQIRPRALPWIALSQPLWGAGPQAHAVAISRKFQ